MSEPLTYALVRHARERAGADACVFLKEGAGTGFAAEHLTYAALDRQVRRAASALAAEGTAGEPVLLLYPSGLDFPVAFLACLYAGAIAVPAPVPGAGTGSAERVASIVRDAGIRHACAPTALHADVRRYLPGTVRLLDPAESPGTDVPPAPGDIAFLQYTSGSTAEPRGVVVGNDNLSYNIAHLARYMPVEGRMAFGGWLPHHHDMGLIGQLLFPLGEGGTSVSMSPMAFAKAPYRWLRAVSGYRLTHSTAPDFGYATAVRRVTDAELDGVDLSGWRYAVNGAEPVRAATLDAFAKRFAPWGLRPEALCPAYGLAEATLLVTNTPGGVPPVIDAAGTVSSGRTTPEMEVLVVDPETRAVRPDGEDGEIWLRGGSVARGYFGRPGPTAEVFAATTADGGGPYLRTGDLGRLRNGELYVTGRRKELIIIGGRNFHPSDVEHAVSGVHEALSGVPGAAFSVDTGADGAGREHCVVVQEVRPGRLGGTAPAELAARMRAAAYRELGLTLANVVLVRPGGVPRTTSGKTRRNRLKEMFTAGAVPALFEELEPAVREGFRRHG